MRKAYVRVTELLTFTFDEDLSDEEIENKILEDIENITLSREDINDVEIKIQE